MRRFFVCILVAATGCGSAGLEDLDHVMDARDTAKEALPSEQSDVGLEQAPLEATSETMPEALPEEVLPPEPKLNYIVVAEDDLIAPAMAHAAWREGLGYKTKVYRVSELVGGSIEPDALLKAVQGVVAAAKADVGEGHPLFLVLYGDAPGTFDHSGKQIPAIPCINESMAGAGCATDNTYGDVDGDGVPEAAVGRIPVFTEAQAAAFLEKAKGFESQYENGLWNRRVAVYTGVGGFGAEIDGLIEGVTMDALKRVSHAFDIVGAYANPSSPYYYTPFEEKVVELFNGGSLLTVYVGHGSSGSMQGLTGDQIDQIKCEHRLPFALFFACLTGNYPADEPSIAEQVLALPRGPIAVFASTDISHPYANAVFVYEAQRVLLDERPKTFGEAMMRAKWALMHHEDDFRQLMDTVATVQVPWDQQERLRRQHLDLYNLLGDPATPMHYPATNAAFDPVQGKMPNGPLHVSGEVPDMASGLAFITLETERDVILQKLDPVDPKNPDPATVQANWEKAVNKVVVSKTVPVNSSHFEADLEVPEDLPTGTYYVKVYADGVTVDGARSDGFGFVEAP